MRSALLVLALAAAALPARAQDPVFTALPVLEIPAVPDLGGATAARTTDDPRSVLQNPALLGLTSGSVRHATAAAPSTTWFGEQTMSVGAASFGFDAGRLSVGVGLAQGTLRTDGRTLADGSRYAPTDRYRALGVGVATRGPVRAALGAMARYVTTTDAPYWTGESFRADQLSGVTADLGAAVSADLAALTALPDVAGLRPALEVTAAYAQQHLGGTVRYSGYQHQSLPRLASLGWSATGGLDAPLGGTTLRLLEAEVAAQTEGSLVRRRDGRTEYALVTGGLSPLDALRGSGTDVATGRRGLRLTLAETVTVSRGRFDGWGYTDAQTRSFEVGTAGLFTLLASTDPSGPVAGLGRFDLRLGRTTVWAGTPHQVRRSTVSLVLGR